MGMAAVHEASDDIKLVKLEGNQLVAAHAFSAILKEGHEELRRAREEYAQKCREINDRAQVMLRDEWRQIVVAHGYDPIETWEQGWLMLDCEYLQHGVAFLRESPHDQVLDPKGTNSLEAMMPASYRVN